MSLDRDHPSGQGPSGARYRIEQSLGAGAMGVVHAAFDAVRGERVAVKSLRDLDADGIFRLKQEFRALAGVVHPNLVRLFDLVLENDRWFFTMELVDGVDLASWVRADARRLRPALVQLAEGIEALHAAGKVHRDLKPTNALVTPSGRVVILDFGLVTDVDMHRVHTTLDRALVGTPAYLSPEQAECRQLGPATDWYSFGVILYEALCGALPFEGGLLHILQSKRERDAAPPSAHRPDVPADLESLCMDLLRRVPGERPRGAEVLARLRGGGVPAPVAEGHSETAPSLLLFGRDDALAKLHGALASTRVDGAPRPVWMVVEGASGLGKSALLAKFVAGLVERQEAVVLSGRCYERELVPFRALDGVMDALSRHLGSRAPLEVEAVLPRDVGALVRLFPVLRRVAAVARAAREPAADADPQDVRARAFAALRELLARVADRRPVAVLVDDLHWGDADSAALFEVLLAPPEPPGVLWVGAWRVDEGTPATEAFMRAAAAARVDGRRVTLQPLGLDDARRLAQALLAGASLDERALQVAKAAAGHPLAVHELAHHVRAAEEGGAPSAGPDVGAADLDELLARRVGALPEVARALLEVLAVAARPLASAQAFRASGLAADDPAASRLRAERLVRGHGERDELEVSHDRIRRAVLDGMAEAAIRARHAALADTLAAADGVDPEVVAFHFVGAGDPARACRKAAEAAAGADATLAFERAARLHQWALDLAPPGVVDDGTARRWREKLGDALANLGRGEEAANALLAAAEGANPAQALELRRRAAEQLLRTGHMDRGLATLATVLESLGVPLAATPGRALVSLLARRALVRLGGLGFRRRDASEVAPSALVRLDVFWSVSTSLGVIDTVRGTDFQTRHLRLALRLGEPYRVARALAAEAAYSGLGGSRARARTRNLVARARRVADSLDAPFAHGWVDLAEGLASYMGGEHERARALCDSAEATFKGCVGVQWELDSARLFGMWSRFYCGDIAELGRRLPARIAEAQARGDIYAATNFRTGLLNGVWLLLGDPERARRELDHAERAWSRREYHTQHFWNALGAATIAIFDGDGAAAWKRIEADEPGLRRAHLLRVQAGRIEWEGLRGRAALACAARASGAERASFLAHAERAHRRLRGEDTGWARAWGAMLHAGILSARYDREGARMALLAAAQHADASHMAFAAALARHQLGALCGEPEAFAAAAARAWFTEQGIPDPPSVAATWAPMTFI